MAGSMAGQPPNDPRRRPDSDDLLDTAASRRYAERMAARAARRSPSTPETYAGRGRPSADRPAAPDPRPPAGRQRREEPRSRRPELEPRAAAPSLAKDATQPVAAGRARNTAIFSILTAFSRVAGLVREVLSARLYGASGPIDAFTLAFQIPNLLRALFADAALSAAFVPVFSELIQDGKRKEAFRLAAHMTWVMLLGLSALVAVCILLCPVVIPLIASDKMGAGNVELAVILTQIMFPVVVLLGVNGLLVGVLNAEDHFSIPALSPVIWNVVIMVFMLAGHVLLDGPDELYGYAIGVLVGTIAQLAMAIPLVRKAGFRLGPRPRKRDPQVRRVLILMIPVALGLGLVNFNLLINSILGAKLGEGAIRAIDAAFRLYMLPQGIFSVAIATVLFPALSRAAARRDMVDLRKIVGDGMAQILVLLVPAGVLSIVLATPLARVVFQGGDWDAQATSMAAEALLVFSITLPLNGLNLLLTRTFFALQQPWTTTKIAVVSLVVNVIVSFALYQPLGIAGIVLGTVAANIAVVGTQLFVLRGQVGGLDLHRTAVAGSKILIAGAVLGGVGVAVASGTESAVGDGFFGALLTIILASAFGGAAYMLVLRLLQVQEAAAIERMATRLLRRG